MTPEPSETRNIGKSKPEKFKTFTVFAQQKKTKKTGPGLEGTKKTCFFQVLLIRLEKVTHLTLMPAAGMSIKM